VATRIETDIIRRGLPLPLPLFGYVNPRDEKEEFLSPLKVESVDKHDESVDKSRPPTIGRDCVQRWAKLIRLFHGILWREKQTRLAVRIIMIIIIVKARVASHNNLLGILPRCNLGTRLQE